MIFRKTAKQQCKSNRKFLLRRQKGIALLFTLSILSVALVTVLIFSSNAITTRKVAATNADNTAARFLADGTVDRALASLMNSKKFNFVCSNYKYFLKQKIISAANRGACDTIWHLEKQDLFTFNKGPLRYANSKSDYYDYDDIRCPSWEYVIFKDNIGSYSVNKIFGRYAYVAISHNDQLNANAIGNLDSDNSDMNQRRLGRWTSEPQFILKKMTDNTNWDESNRISPEKIQTAFRKQNFDDTDDGWTELDVFFHDVTGQSVKTKADRTLKLMLEQYFDLETIGDYNKYSVNGNVWDGTTAPTAGQSYRFPMIRTDWNSISVSDVMSAVPWLNAGSANQAIRQQTAANLINYCAPVTRPAVSDNDDWTTGEPSYTGNKRTPYINEAASRIELSGRLGQKVVDPPGGTVISINPYKAVYNVRYENCRYDASIAFKVELVNMYPSSGKYQALDVNAPLLYGNLTFDYYTGATKAWISKTIDFAANTGLTVSADVESSNGYPCYLYTANTEITGITTHTETGLSTQYPDESLFNADMKIRNVRLTFNRIILRTTDGQNADLALMPQVLINGTGYELISGEKQVCPDSVTGFLDVQTNDPRCNLGRTMWSLQSVNEGNWDGNIGAKNTVVAITANDDPEDAKDPAYSSDSTGGHISTAFIRHDNMQSLWELGAIHRGEPWRTVNLKCAKPENIAGMGDYKEGDGHILDQVTLQEQALIERTDPGYINLNTSSDFGGNAAPFVFKALFTNFPQTTNGDYDTLDQYPDSTQNIKILEGGSIDSTNADADKCAEQLATAVGRVLSNSSYPTRRTAVLPYDDTTAEQFNAIIPTTGTDAQREEIFARIVNLLKWTRQKTTGATILVIAQTIQDVGGASLTYEYPDSSATGQTLDEYCRMLFGHRSFSGYNLISSDAYPANGSKQSVLYGKYDIGFDRILGESKLIVRLKWDNKANNNKGAWKIVRKEYVD